MNPIDINNTVRQLLQWDVERIAALVTGLIFGGLGVLWLMQRLRPKPTSSRAEDMEISNEQLAQMKARFQQLSAEKQQLEDQVQQLQDVNQALREENERLKAQKPVVSGSGREGDELDLDVLLGRSDTSERTVYYQGRKFRFCGFGPSNCRIEPLDGSKPSFLVPTHQLFHDAEGKRRITRDSIVVKR